MRLGLKVFEGSVKNRETGSRAECQTRRATCRRIGRMCLGTIHMVSRNVIARLHISRPCSRNHRNVRHSSHHHNTKLKFPSRGAMCTFATEGTSFSSCPLLPLLHPDSNGLLLAVPGHRPAPAHAREQFPHPVLPRHPARARHLLREPRVVQQHPARRARAGDHDRRRRRRGEPQRAPRHGGLDVAQAVSGVHAC